MKLALLLMVSAMTLTASAQQLHIAAASDLSAAFKELTAAYEKSSKSKVTVSFGSSGNFFAQIQNGAPFDLFFSADSSYPEKLEQAGLAEPGSMTPYAVGRLVLWAPKSARFNIADLKLQALTRPEVRRIAIANPQHAPYGRAAEAVLRHERLYDTIREKLVLGENISQTAQFVQSGNADVGFIALSLALSPQMKDAGSYWLVPQELHPLLKQAAVIVKASRNKDAAHRFLSFLASAEGRAIMERYGFSLPDQKK